MNEIEKHPTGNLHKANNLKKLIIENPDLPLVFLANEEANNGDYSTMFCSCVYAELGEILDCCQEINDEICFTDRDDFEETVYDNLEWDDENEDMPENWFEEETKRIVAEYEPYWKKCIIVTVGN